MEKGLKTKKQEDHQDHEVQLNTDYDVYFCVDCNEWLEDPCGDPGCDYCAGRPETPLSKIEPSIH